MSSFYFKNLTTGIGHNSYDKGIYLKEAPALPVAFRDIVSIPIEGRDGGLVVDKQSYKDVEIPLELLVVKDEAQTWANQMSYIYSWFDGRGEITFSNMPEYHYITKIIDLDSLKALQSAGGYHTVKLLCEPFKYSAPYTMNDASSPMTVTNPSYITAKPIITVFGTGNVTLTVNGVPTTLNSISSYVTMNSETMQTYKDTVNKSSTKVGGYPVLRAGSNTITWTGTVTNVRVETKWRYR